MKTYIISFETPTGTQLIEIVAESIEAALKLAGLQRHEGRVTATVIKEHQPDIDKAMVTDLLVPSMSLFACLLAFVVAEAGLRRHFKH